jgi:hypothetical protein
MCFYPILDKMNELYTIWHLYMYVQNFICTFTQHQCQIYMHNINLCIIVVSLFEFVKTLPLFQK